MQDARCDFKLTAEATCLDAMHHDPWKFKQRGCKIRAIRGAIVISEASTVAVKGSLLHQALQTLSVTLHDTWAAPPAAEEGPRAKRF